MLRGYSRQASGTAYLRLRWSEPIPALIPKLTVCDRPTVDTYPSAWPDVQHHIQQPVRRRTGSDVYKKDGE